LVSPTIDTNPSNVTVCVGGAAGFNVSVSGAIGNLSYQWEESNDNGGGDVWASAVGGSGAATASYTSPAGTLGSIYYRVLVNDDGIVCPNLISNSASLTVNADPVVGTQPTATQTVCVGTSTNLSVIATGGVAGLTYQWRASTTSGSGFSNISGATSASYAAATTSTGTTYYQVVINDAGTDCGSTTSSEATVTVNADPVVGTQPTATQTVCIGTSSNLTVAASGGVSGLTYQWQSSTTSGSGFANISGAT
jgi:hypothetical protein